jgi:hypothetical protein
MEPELLCSQQPATGTIAPIDLNIILPLRPIFQNLSSTPIRDVGYISFVYNWCEDTHI